MRPKSSPADPPHAWSHATLRGSETGRIRRLKGFLKSAHFEPDSHSSASDAFVRKAGAPDIEERAEALHRELRQAYGYKRRELIYSCEGGSALLRTPAFEVALTIEQDAEPRAFRFVLTVSRLTDPTVISAPAFLQVFRYRCQSVVVAFPRSIDIEQQIDVLEESPTLADLLEYPADASWLTIQLPGPSIRMELRADAATFSLPPGGDLEELITGTDRLLKELQGGGMGFGPENVPLI